MAFLAAKEIIIYCARLWTREGRDWTKPRRQGSNWSHRTEDSGGASNFLAGCSLYCCRLCSTGSIPFAMLYWIDYMRKALKVKMSRHSRMHVKKIFLSSFLSSPVATKPKSSNEHKWENYYLFYHRSNRIIEAITLNKHFKGQSRSFVQAEDWRKTRNDKWGNGGRDGTDLTTFSARQKGGFIWERMWMLHLYQVIVLNKISITCVQYKCTCTCTNTPWEKKNVLYKPGSNSGYLRIELNI